MSDVIKYWTTQAAAWIEVIGAVVILLGVLEATGRVLTAFVSRTAPPESKEAVRPRLGAWLAVALEFELAADILRTAEAPTWNDVGLLVAIIGLRTILNFFLQAEIEKAQARGIMEPRTGDGVVAGRRG